VVYPPNLLGYHNQFSGTDLQRSSDLQQMLDNSDTKAIIFARGGYGSVRTLQGINFEPFEKSPKWLVGYSDITVFHSYVNTQCRVETLHAPMPINLNNPNFDIECFSILGQALFGQLKEYAFSSHPMNRLGETTAELVGGNLSVLYSLRGTPADLNTSNKILFIEDLDEYLYHIDRMMMNLKYGNKLNNLKGIIVGSFTEMKDNNTPFGKDAYEIIADVCSGLDIPFCFGFEAGHALKNLPLYFGRQVKLSVTEKGCKISF
jgi:muramoyltetrapeptide carboxypeptidase